VEANEVPPRRVSARRSTSWTAGSRASNSERNRGRECASWTSWTGHARLKIRLLCDPCHDLFTAGNLRGWVQRGWAVAVDLAPWMGREPAATRAQMRLSLADTLHLLVERLDTGRRITVAERP